MPKLDPYAVSQLDKIIRAIRTSIEIKAKALADDDNRELANPDDIRLAAIQVFEADPDHPPEVMRTL